LSGPGNPGAPVSPDREASLRVEPSYQSFAMSNTLKPLAVGLTGLLLAGCASTSLGDRSRPDAARAELWVDTLRGEPIRFEELLDELQGARVIYLGEYHPLTRHHELQSRILRGLADRGVSLVLAMEQFEYFTQPVLDQFNAGEMALDQLVAETEWDKRWRANTNYHALVGIARERGIPLLALNARAETIRAVGRMSLEGIRVEQRAELPREMYLDDPVYERLLTRVLGVHMAFDPGKLRPVIQAQIVRDEVMADRLVSFLSSPAGEGRVGVVLCGRGHCEYGLGMPDRVAWRRSGWRQRVVLFSQSGDLRLTEEERRQAREVEMPHQFLRDLGRLPSDFMHVVALPEFDESAVDQPGR